jgi:hypothetical protein
VPGWLRRLVFGVGPAWSAPPASAAPPAAAKPTQPPPPSDTDASLLGALALALPKGEAVRIVYHGGSRPGSIRDVRPIELTSEMLRALDVAEGVEKTFRLDRMELAPTGARPTPRATATFNPAPSDRSGFTVQVMRRPHQQELLAAMVGASPLTGGLVTDARCVPRGGSGVEVEISGTVVGALYSKYWQHYQWTLGSQPSECGALVSDPDCTILLDLALPALDPELAPHDGAAYNCDVVGEAKYQDTLKGILAERRATRPDQLVPLVMASLVDDGAGGIRVEVNGAPVGALSPGNVKRYRALRNLQPQTPGRVPACIGRLGGMPWNSSHGLYDIHLDLWLPSDMPHPETGYKKRPRK